MDWEEAVRWARLQNHFDTVWIIADDHGQYEIYPCLYGMLYRMGIEDDRVRGVVLPNGALLRYE